tara:strand:- start:1672 stop:1938 length:267 start_codon:yes stop_codon:yes gene_type:complete
MKKVLLALVSTLAIASPAVAGEVPTSEGYINGHHVMAVDGGPRGTDLLIVNGGQQDIAVNCNVTEEYTTYGTLNGNTVYSIVEQWCSW